MRTLGRFSMGVGDRFGHEGPAQLAAMKMALDEHGVAVTPVWNKSFREHSIIGTAPANVRAAADAAVAASKWSLPYFVDADHVGLKNVDGFVAASDFFTLDVADFIPKGRPAGRPSGPAAGFVERHNALCGKIALPGGAGSLSLDRPGLESAAMKFVPAVTEAGRIYRRILEQGKDAGDIVVEVSMDETDEPQTPGELLLILAAIADEGIPARTIAPRFTGRFNKGVDYVGDVGRFMRDFEMDQAVIRYAVDNFGLPDSLKISVHSGSDKFSLYPGIRKRLEATGGGLHLKTAGTTWLEEVAGLASVGGEGLAIAAGIYCAAYDRLDELCGPYATVIDIDRKLLPSPREITGWNANRFVRALVHDKACPDFNPHMRQLVHVGYKVAAELGARFTRALEANSGPIGRMVTDNIYERHIRPLFIR